MCKPINSKETNGFNTLYYRPQKALAMEVQLNSGQMALYQYCSLLIYIVDFSKAMGQLRQFLDLEATAVQ